MSYGSPLGSPTTNTRMKSPGHLAPVSGMCAACTADCAGTCDIGLSAMRGTEALLPFAADINQFASEKTYPLDFSHFAVNGRVFGVEGLPPDPMVATYPNADIRASFGLSKPVPCAAPSSCRPWPSWPGANISPGRPWPGCPSSSARTSCPRTPVSRWKASGSSSAPLVAEMLAAFRRYRRGLGDIVLQANCDDEFHGLLEYAIDRLERPVGRAQVRTGGQRHPGHGARAPGSRTPAASRASAGSCCPTPTIRRSPRPTAAATGRSSRGSAACPSGTKPGSWPASRGCARLGAERICFKSGPFASPRHRRHPPHRLRGRGRPGDPRRGRRRDRIESRPDDGRVGRPRGRARVRRSQDTGVACRQGASPAPGRHRRRLRDWRTRSSRGSPSGRLTSDGSRWGGARWPRPWSAGRWATRWRGAKSPRSSPASDRGSRRSSPITDCSRATSAPRPRRSRLGRSASIPT
ncbi:MAG: hypothetical protein M0C28_46000 [Candidatus Moduliflexus flocculans]|nr:hypothetical protein [Candidatus Moduliflexus flocculans]